MSVTGLCQVCEHREAEYACHRCGAAVCSIHFDREQGICVNCAGSDGADDVFVDGESDVPQFR